MLWGFQNHLSSINLLIPTAILNPCFVSVFPFRRCQLPLSLGFPLCQASMDLGGPSSCSTASWRCWMELGFLAPWLWRKRVDGMAPSLFGICLWMFWMEADVWTLMFLGYDVVKVVSWRKLLKEVVVLKDTIYRLWWLILFLMNVSVPTRMGSKLKLIPDCNGKCCFITFDVSFEFRMKEMWVYCSNFCWISKDLVWNFQTEL